VVQVLLYSTVVRRGRISGGQVSELIASDSFLEMVPTIDWVTISQRHAFAPELGETRIVIPEDALERVRTSRGFVMARVSADGTSASCDIWLVASGGRVMLSFNPSKVLCPDGLDGCRSMAEVLSVCNFVLRNSDRTRGLDFPLFTSSIDDGVISFSRDQRRFGQGDAFSGATGAQLSRVDVCECWQTGSASDLRFFMLGASQHASRAGAPIAYGASGCETLVWGSKLRKTKLYSKGLELAAHGGEALSDVASWATSCGLVRHEVQLRRRELVSLGLELPCNWRPNSMSDVLSSRRPFADSVTKSPIDSVFDRLLAVGLSKAHAFRAQSVLAAHFRGHDVRSMMAPSTWRQVRKQLVLAGFDIRVPLNVEALVQPTRVITLSVPLLPARFRRNEAALGE
jgi:hypothetical protein